jgi:hypothetical protein
MRLDGRRSSDRLDVLELRSRIHRMARELIPFVERGRGGAISQPRRLGEIDAEPVAPALVFAGHLGA